jgi:hypothetical protein
MFLRGAPWTQRRRPRISELPFETENLRLLRWIRGPDKGMLKLPQGLLTRNFDAGELASGLSVRMIGTEALF